MNTEKLKSDEQVVFSHLMIGMFLVGWFILGVIGTAITASLALFFVINFGREGVYSIFSGNLVGVILNLIGFGILGIGACLATIGIFAVGIVGVFDNPDPEQLMRDIRKRVVEKMAKAEGK